MSLSRRRHRIAQVLADEIRRRDCPACGFPLDEAIVQADFKSHSVVALGFICQTCGSRSSTLLAVTAQIEQEAYEVDRALKGPITSDELLDLHQALQGMTSLSALAG